MKTFSQFCDGYNKQGSFSFQASDLQGTIPIEYFYPEAKCHHCGADKKLDSGLCSKCGRFGDQKCVDLVCSKCGKSADRNGPGELKCVCGNKTFNKKYE